MKLNDEEKRILDGEQREITQRCMKFPLDYGEAAGAECLVKLKRLGLSTYVIMCY